MFTHWDVRARDGAPTGNCRSLLPAGRRARQGPGRDLDAGSGRWLACSLFQHAFHVILAYSLVRTFFLMIFWFILKSIQCFPPELSSILTIEIHICSNVFQIYKLLNLQISKNICGQSSVHSLPGTRFFPPLRFCLPIYSSFFMNEPIFFSRQTLNPPL